MRDAFFETLERLMGKNEKIVFLTADLGYKLFERIAGRFPGRVINVGIREATMIGMAAGLSREGLVPVVYSLAPFVSLRAIEQIRVDLCYNALPAVLVGMGSGLAYGPNGPTHMGLEDAGAMAALPKLTIMSPCDAAEVRMLLPRAVRSKAPVYLRLARAGEPRCHVTRPRGLRIGRPSVLKKGSDALAITYGTLAHEVLGAVRELEAEEGHSVRVLSWHTLKPLGEAALLDQVEGGIPVMVIEEQMPGGSLGSRVALCLKEREAANPFCHLHLPEEYPDRCGDREYLLDRARLSKAHLKRRMREFLGVAARRSG